jgi:hypothetical protein
MNYIILGLKVLIFLWVMSWIFTYEVMKIYALLQLERNKYVVRVMQWEIFVFIGCSVILFYVVNWLLSSPVL